MAEGDGSDPVSSAQIPAPVASLDPNPAGAVFVSYASQDAAVAESLCATLEHQGLTCWIAPRDVRPGDFYADAIVNAINACPVLLLVLSKNSVDSAHVLREVERASAKRRPIVAFRLDSTPLPPGLEYFLSASQWIDASGGTPERGFPKLVESLRGRITSTPKGESERPAVQPPAKRRLNRIFIVVTAALGAALVYVIADRFWFSKHVTAGQRPTTATNVVSDKSIAVLPFVDLSEKKDQEYFADGMAEEILDLLVKIPGLTVIGRTSSFQFKGKNEDLRTIGTLLNAAHVLEGSVRKSGEQVRITAQLINTHTGTHEWSETYDRQLGDVLKLQDSIAAAVVRELQLTVDSGDLNSRSALQNTDAYDLILRGRHAADRWDQEGLDEAVRLFQQALIRDPTSADASADLALTYEFQGEEGYLEPTAAFEQARRAAAAALKLDPKSALAHYVLGLIHLSYDWDWSAAKREFQQEATLAPGGARALIGEENLSLTLGRWDDALRQIKAALALDPLYVASLYDLTEIQMRRGHLPEAEAAIRRALDVRPTYDWGHWLLGVVLLARGDRDAALLEMQRVPSDEARQTGLAMAYYALGRKADSDDALASLVNEHAATSAYVIATAYAYRSQPDEAMHWLERAYDQKDPGLIYVKVEQPLKSLEGDPRFKAFLRKMNLPE